ncbi:MAG: response regulator [Phenylobacterium sp.]|uniref:hybrid sensor histidine kinase/response regulator n=1 Tax=Phenylobacterium sp. TaxID=1871053 RepID=UPI0025F0FEC5|nr:hybrid sensor histidine kinase/response regulator [Phenylobacterium sp.]MBI1200408.1 response regulator [Phenylobacterium sp.]
MTEKLKILILEDEETDARLLIDELEQAGFAFECRVAKTGAEFVKLLQGKASAVFPFDLVLADHSLPGYDALAALGEVQRRGLDAPFIVVTGSLADEEAVECLRQGATDFLLKDRMKRLGPAVTRALSERRERQERDRMQEEVNRSRAAAAAALRKANATLEARIAERTRELVEANDRLTAEVAERQRAQQALQQTQKLQATGRLAAGVAHHFNNLLTIVMGSVEMALQGVTDERSRRRLTIALQASERGAGLTRQLLSFARKQMIRPELVEPSGRLADIGALFAGVLRSDVTVEAEVPEDLWSIFVDISELELAVLNLAFNARDAMPEGGKLTLRAANQNLDGEYDLTGRFVMIELADTGVGIAPDVLPRVFDPFFTTKEAGAGGGLGLSQVHGFAHQAGGAIDIESMPGEGTTIRIFLPAAQATPLARPVGSAAPRSGRPALGRILVVDDDVEVAEVAANMLQHHGFVVVQTHRAADAMALLDGGEMVDLVLSDIVMPGGMNGIELAEALRKKFPDLPILLATGHSDSVKDAAARGLQIITKPFLSSDLFERVNGLLQPAA